MSASPCTPDQLRTQISLWREQITEGYDEGDSLRGSADVLLDSLVASVTALVRLEETLAADDVRRIVFSEEATRFRAQANKHTVGLPYADNRYVRLLDDVRGAVSAP